VKKVNGIGVAEKTSTIIKGKMWSDGRRSAKTYKLRKELVREDLGKKAASSNQNLGILVW
jgi:hypothetical protein